MRPVKLEVVRLIHSISTITPDIIAGSRIDFFDGLDDALVKLNELRLKFPTFPYAIIRYNTDGHGRMEYVEYLNYKLIRDNK